MDRLKSNAYVSAERGWFLAALEVVLLFVLLLFACLFVFVLGERERERERLVGLGNHES